MKDIFGTEQLDEWIIENINNNNIILLYFGAVWCGPCKQLKEKLKNQDIMKTMPRLAVAHLDIEHTSNSNLVKRYKVKSLPTQVFVRLDKNKVIEHSRIEGYDFTKLKMEYDLLD